MYHLYRRRGPAWTRERIIQAIQQFHARMQRWPAGSDFGGGILPYASTAWRLFGSLDAARQAAGMPADEKLAKRSSGSKWERSWAGTHSHDPRPE